MATLRILIVQGHPDPAGDHFCHALAERHRQGATSASHEVRSIGGRSARVVVAMGMPAFIYRWYFSAHSV